MQIVFLNYFLNKIYALKYRLSGRVRLNHELWESAQIAKFGIRAMISTNRIPNLDNGTLPDSSSLGLKKKTFILFFQAILTSIIYYSCFVL